MVVEEGRVYITWPWAEFFVRVRVYSLCQVVAFVMVARVLLVDTHRFYLDRGSLPAVSSRLLRIGGDMSGLPQHGDIHPLREYHLILPP